MANKIYKTWHVLPLDYENLNFGSILTDYHMFDKGEGCFVYIIDGYGNGEMGPAESRFTRSLKSVLI
ncbi:hypothetical protein [Escherichia coli]|uniref:hypothetical protein n=1 Tax=Escherichia coli TaxID=562 RepID=UPI003F88B98A